MLQFVPDTIHFYFSSCSWIFITQINWRTTIKLYIYYHVELQEEIKLFIYHSNNQMNKINMHYRSGSYNNLDTITLKQISMVKRNRAISNSIAKLQRIKSTYELPSIREHQQQDKTEDESSLRFSNRDFADFYKKSRKLCEDICFHLQAFVKLHSEDHRKKAMLAKIYGWDYQFNEIFFGKRDQIRHDLTPSILHLKLGLDSLTNATRNTYNKLRLFLNELILNNKHQQQLQSKYMKNQLQNHLSKLNNKMNQIKRDSESKTIMKYVDQISKTQELMLESKLKIRNKMPIIMQISNQTGRVHINQFYMKEEGSIADIEQYITVNRNRL